MNGISIRDERAEDEGAIRSLVRAAFGGDGEADLIDALRDRADIVLSLVAERGEQVCGHVLFSRLMVVSGDDAFPAVALAPLAVLPSQQKSGIGSALVEAAHERLKRTGESLSIVLGDPAYYGRFGYSHDRAAGFASAYQSPALQALAWGAAPTGGRLDYARPFAAIA